MSNYRKITRVIFWGVAFVLSAVSWVVMDKLNLLWNLWAQVADSLFILIAAMVLSRLIPRWLDLADDR